MPLRLDNAERGAHAVHVRSHSKLGKHRTILKSIFPIVNTLIERGGVKRLGLGRVITSKGSVTHFSPRIECVWSDRTNLLRVMMVTEEGAQLLNLTVRGDRKEEYEAMLNDLWARRQELYDAWIGSHTKQEKATSMKEEEQPKGLATILDFVEMQKKRSGK